LNFKLANIVNDKEVLEVAKIAAEKLVEEDHTLTLTKNLELKNYLQSQKARSGWGKIS
jgi:ATP-dependent DNA helicase RecG